MRTLPEVMEALNELDKSLEVLQRELPPVIRDYEADHESKDVAIARVMHTHSGPEWKARAAAYDECARIILRAAKSKGRVEAGKTLLKITLGRLDGLRSELSALKSEMEMVRVGHGT